MTARAQPRELEHFVSLGAEGVIAKPFDPMTLAASVRNYIGGLAGSIAARRQSFVDRTRENARALPTSALRAVRSGHRGGGARPHPQHRPQHRRRQWYFRTGRHEPAAAELEAAVGSRLEGGHPPADVERAMATLIARIAQA